MVDQAQAAGRKTRRISERVWFLAETAVTIAAAIKAYGLHSVKTSAGHLPLWQFVGALLLLGVIYRLYMLTEEI